MPTKSDIKFYLTSNEPYHVQSSPSQSIGGYASSTEVAMSSLLSADLHVYGTSLSIDTPFDNPSKILVGNEIIRVSGTGTTLVSSEREAVSTSSRYHVLGEPLYDVSNVGLFNNSFSSDNKQYRCISIKNTGADIFYDVKLYFRYLSRNPKCTVKLAIEVPCRDIFIGNSTGGNSISITDSTLAALYEEDEMLNRVVRILDGNNINQTRTIASYDKDTGTFTFTEQMPTPIEAETTYLIENSPSTETPSGTIIPNGLGTSTYMSSLSTADRLTNAVSIDIAGREHGGDLYPHEVVYVWLERTLNNNVDTYRENRVIFSLAYKTSI